MKNAMTLLIVITIGALTLTSCAPCGFLPSVPPPEQPPPGGQPPPGKPPEEQPPQGQPPSGGPPGEVQITFTADRTDLQPGECATLRWSVQGGEIAQLNGQPVDLAGQQEVCPQETSSYALAVYVGVGPPNPPKAEREVVISVGGVEGPPPQGQPPQEPPPPEEHPPEAQPPEGRGVEVVNLRVEPGVIPPGGCAMLRWEVLPPGEWPVRLDGQEVPHVGEKEVCPEHTTTYELLAEAPGEPQERAVTLHVEGGPGPEQPPSPQEPPSPGPPSPQGVDLAVTDLYPDKLPQGKVWVKITNNGPGTVTNASVPLSCSNVGNPPSGGSSTTITKQGTLTVNLSPGQTAAFDTSIYVNTVQGYWYQVTCTISPSNDPKSSNNTYSEKIAQPTPTPTLPLLHIISADLKITDLFPKTLPVGRVYMRITNGGPDDLVNGQVELSCGETHPGGGASGGMPPGGVTISVKAHQTIEYDTGINIDTSKGTYKVTCTISYMLDPNSSNNTYSENIPP